MRHDEHHPSKLSAWAGHTIPRIPMAGHGWRQPLGLIDFTTACRTRDGLISCVLITNDPLQVQPLQAFRLLTALTARKMPAEAFPLGIASGIRSEFALRNRTRGRHWLCFLPLPPSL